MFKILRAFVKKYIILGNALGSMEKTIFNRPQRWLQGNRCIMIAFDLRLRVGLGVGLGMGLEIRAGVKEPRLSAE